MVPMADLTEDQRRCDPWAVPAPRHPADADGPGDAVLLLRHLTFKQARSILLVDIEGYSVDEAAELIRVHRSTLAITRRRGLARLRAILEQEARETRSHAEQDDG
jgi:RNA polymerase sigma-70 factor (ECF subfamily)